MVSLWGFYLLLCSFSIFFLSMISSMFCFSGKTSDNLSSYECGINQIEDYKTPFYLHFFVIGILFLLFDVELIICIPMVYMNMFEKNWSFVWFFFFFVLFIGMCLEMSMGSLDWKE